MTQENGMPIRFQAWDIPNKEMVRVTGLDWKEGLEEISTETYVHFPYEKKTCEIIQAIGATSSDDPPQELYVRDVVEIELLRKNLIGEIVWRNLAVCVKFKEYDKMVYYGLGDFFRSGVGKIKKLGSRYTKEGKEILEKAGLEKPKVCGHLRD